LSELARTSEEFRYDVCLSFAGEDRIYVEDVAALLAAAGVRVFYDKYEQVDLWGKDLYTHLDYIYRKAARYCVLFVSAHYARKIWTNHERQSAQARALEANQEYVLPAIFDDTEVPGLRPTIGHIDLRETDADRLAELIRKKLGEPRRRNYFPPIPDRLYRSLGVKGTKVRKAVLEQARQVHGCMQRMTPDERTALFFLVVHACPADLPKNFHAHVDLIHRDSGLAHAEVLQLLGNLRSLGISCRVYTNKSHDYMHGRGKEIGSGSEIVALHWEYRVLGLAGGNITEVALDAILSATEGFCIEHAREAVVDYLDFGQLASVTARNDHDANAKLESKPGTST
jgi:TIR domain